MLGLTLSATVVQTAAASRDEPFSRLAATLSIAGGSATTQDLRFESKDLTLTAGGALKLDGSAVSLQGQLQLSEALSKQAAAAVVRVTGQSGRVTCACNSDRCRRQIFCLRQYRRHGEARRQK